MKKVLLLLIACVTLTSCGVQTFVKSSENTWSTIQLRENISADKVWQKAVDVLSEKYEIAFIDNDARYIRTGWISGFDGNKQWYVARATIKLSNDGKQIRIKSEAKSKLLVGYDAKLLSTLKTDIGGVLGRVTR